MGKKLHFLNTCKRTPICGNIVFTFNSGHASFNVPRYCCKRYIGYDFNILDLYDRSTANKCNKQIKTLSECLFRNCQSIKVCRKKLYF